MKLKAERGPCVKMVAVAERGGGSAAVLSWIFQFCGRDRCRVMEYGKPLPRGAAKSVLLLCGDAAESDPEGWDVCVAERELSFRAAGAAKLITYSLARDDADFTARNIRMTPDGDAAFEIVGFGVIGRVRLNGGSLSDVEEVLAAACAAVGAGIPFAEVLKALNSLRPVESAADRVMYKPEGQFTE
ncbi:hypothetical protein EQM14_10420 [Caproiciproducens sp. NJN-50]|uniref:hypothetical protein n=1 Tax=Acutalibacteraceae TaxID=3082771 RepID=UPI000FFE132C|nr:MULTISPECIES: hypothetical protein [Acutalibacteraceae]QAT50145.1 hypothetical protein EQM14_10420 [Caproiciproducens sp. NJN-50]